MNFCHSCGIILDGKIAKEHSNNYCTYCVNEQGVLKEREVIQKGVVEWLKMFTPNAENFDLMKRADFYLKAMPTWADKN